MNLKFSFEMFITFKSLLQFCFWFVELINYITPMKHQLKDLNFTMFVYFSEVTFPIKKILYSF